MEQDQGYNRMMNHAMEKNRNQSGNVNYLSHNVECNTDVPRAGSSIPTNKATTWGGWMPATTGKETAWRPYVGHPSMYPHQYSGRTPYQYGSPRHLQPPHMTPQSWTPVGWPLILPHSQPHSLRNTSPSFNHNMNQTVLLPQPTYSPHSNPTYNGTQPPFSQSQAPPRDYQTMETSSKTHHGRPSPPQTRDGSSCPAATSNSINNTTAALTKTTPSNKTNSPMSIASPVVSRDPGLTSHAGIGLDQTGYGYGNQPHMIVMPYYQYNQSMAPYCSWAAPVLMQWPVAQLPSTPMHSTPNNTSTMAAQSKHTDSSLPHTALTFTPQSEKHITTTSPPVMTSKYKEVYSPASNNIPSFKPGRGGHMNMNYTRNRPYYNQAFHTPPYYSSPEQSEHKKMEQPKVCLSSFPPAFSSAQKVAMSPCKFPRPVAPGHPQTVPPLKGFGSSGGDGGGGGVTTTKPVMQEEHCTTVPMTPPPTPLPNIEEISDAVANLNAS